MRGLCLASSRYRWVCCYSSSIEKPKSFDPIAFERHENGTFRDRPFHSKVKNMNAVTMGKHFITVFPKGIVEIVSAAQNTGGLIIQTGLIKTSTGVVDLYVGPTGSSISNAAIIFSGNGSSISGSDSEIVMPYPIRIPAGQALWAYASTPGGAIALTWDLLA